MDQPCPNCGENLTSDCQGIFCEYCGWIRIQREGWGCKDAGEKCDNCPNDVHNKKEKAHG